MLGMFGIAIDVQAGGLGAWTFIGTGRLVAGSITLYGGSSRLDPAWWVLVARDRAAPCVHARGHDRDDPVALLDAHDRPRGHDRRDGAAEADVDPDGVVRHPRRRWRARDEPGHADPRGRRGAGGGGRGHGARGRARGRRRRDYRERRAARSGPERVRLARVTRSAVCTVRGVGRMRSPRGAAPSGVGRWRSASFTRPGICGRVPGPGVGVCSSRRRSPSAATSGTPARRGPRRSARSAACARVPRLRAAGPRAARHLGRPDRDPNAAACSSRATGPPGQLGRRRRRRGRRCGRRRGGGSRLRRRSGDDAARRTCASSRAGRGRRRRSSASRSTTTRATSVARLVDARRRRTRRRRGRRACRARTSARTSAGVAPSSAGAGGANGDALERVEQLRAPSVIVDRAAALRCVADQSPSIDDEPGSPASSAREPAASMPQ